MNVRMLQKDDVAAFKTIRLRGLQEHPEAFGSSYDEEAEVDLQKMAQWFNTTDNVMFGAFVDEQLVGCVGLRRYERVKTRHRASIGAMYVVPEARGRAVGSALMEAALAYARTMIGLEDVVLSVTVGNGAARQLYTKVGFVPYGIDPRYIRVDDQYFDIEWMILKVGKDG